uniref:FHA domain-containing protein n=1 Tax=Panagrolaimus superbus TaxID=310955 RepID=A0A914YJ15_9BILA
MASQISDLELNDPEMDYYLLPVPGGVQENTTEIVLKFRHGRCLVGSHVEADVTIVGKSVSGKHVEFVYSTAENEIFAKDFNSTNGTVVFDCTSHTQVDVHQKFISVGTGYYIGIAGLF